MSNAAFSELIGDLAKEISSGKPLHESLARHPKLFPPLYTSMVRAGETGGFLEDVLHRLFDGSKVRLVHALLDDEDLSKREFEALRRRILEVRRKEEGRG